MNSIAVSDEARSAIIDQEQLRLLSLGHYVVGGLEILFASMFIFHFVMFFFIAGDPQFFRVLPSDGVVKPDHPTRLLIQPSLGVNGQPNSLAPGTHRGSVRRPGAAPWAA